MFDLIEKPVDQDQDVPDQWTATYICTETGWNGNAAIYEMSPPHQGYAKVVVSAINNGYAYETYIFGIEADGEVNFCELNGSTRGTTSHTQVLTSIGYIVK